MNLMELDLILLLTVFRNFKLVIMNFILHYLVNNKIMRVTMMKLVFNKNNRLEMKSKKIHF